MPPQPSGWEPGLDPKQSDKLLNWWPSTTLPTMTGPTTRWRSTMQVLQSKIFEHNCRKLLKVMLLPTPSTSWWPWTSATCTPRSSGTPPRRWLVSEETTPCPGASWELRVTTLGDQWRWSTWTLTMTLWTSTLERDSRKINYHTIGYSTRNSESSSKFHHLAFLVALLLRSSLWC